MAKLHLSTPFREDVSEIDTDLLGSDPQRTRLIRTWQRKLEKFAEVLPLDSKLVMTLKVVKK